MSRPCIPDGVWPVMVTPFDAQGVIDWNGYASLIEFYLRHGEVGLFAVCGSSEALHLTHAEMLALTGIAGSARTMRPRHSCGSADTRAPGRSKRNACRRGCCLSKDRVCRGMPYPLSAKAVLALRGVAMGRMCRELNRDLSDGERDELKRMWREFAYGLGEGMR